MSSGATTVLAPPKPWERPKSIDSGVMLQPPAGANSVINQPPSTTAPAPPLPPPMSMPTAPAMPFPSPGYSNYPYNSASYSSPYNSNYSAPYYSSYNAPPYPSYNAHPFPAYSLESTTRPLLDSLNHIIQAVNHVACFLDSTVFSVWTAVSAITGLIGAIKNIRQHRWLLWIKNKLKGLKAVSGRKRIVLLSVILSAVLVAANLVKEKKEDSSTASASLDEIKTNPIAVVEDDLVFVRANYAFNPDNPTTSNQLSFQAGDVIAISKADSAVVEDFQSSRWIVGRMKDGRSGFLPSNYVSIIK